VDVSDPSGTGPAGGVYPFGSACLAYGCTTGASAGGQGQSLGSTFVGLLEGTVGAPVVAFIAEYQCGEQGDPWSWSCVSQGLVGAVDLAGLALGPEDDDLGCPVMMAANEADRTAAAAEGGAISTGDVSVYTSENAAGDVNYVGITNNIERRAAEQFASKGINIEPIQGLQNLSRADARSVEQC
jgi:hypothetical protein